MYQLFEHRYNKKCSWATNQHIRMISETSALHHRIYYILKYIYEEKTVTVHSINEYTPSE